MAEKTQMEKRIDEFRIKIAAIQKAFKQIKRTGISESVLYQIIQRSSQRFVDHKYSKPLTIGQVKAIISGIENLQEYIFDEEQKP